MTETWYVLEDGTSADPQDCSYDKQGRLSARGVPVALRSADCYMSRSVDAEAERKAKKAPEPKAMEPEAKEEKPEEPKRHYKTRESKAD